MRVQHADGTPFAGEDHPAMVTLRTGKPTTGVVRPEFDVVMIG